MSHAIRLSQTLLQAAKTAADEEFRTVPRQIEYWASIGQEFDRRQRAMRLIDPMATMLSEAHTHAMTPPVASVSAAAHAHFATIAKVTREVNQARDVEQANMTWLERVALGLTMHRQQDALKRQMLGDKYSPEPSEPLVSLKSIHDRLHGR